MLGQGQAKESTCKTGMLLANGIEQEESERGYGVTRHRLTTIMMVFEAYTRRAGNRKDDAPLDHTTTVPYCHRGSHPSIVSKPIDCAVEKSTYLVLRPVGMEGLHRPEGFGQ